MRKARYPVASIRRGHTGLPLRRRHILPAKPRDVRLWDNYTCGHRPVTDSSRTAPSCGMMADKQAVVVDPGGDVDRILGAIEQAGVTVERSG